MIRFIAIDSGKEINQHLNLSFKRLAKVLEEIDVAPEMQKCVQTHFSRRYPDSKHWSPDKVTVTGKNKIHVGVEGVMRAYRDIVIRPLHRKHLTIPLHAEAYGMKAPEVKGLFRMGNLLAVREGGSYGMPTSIIPWYLLVDEVHQKQDETLMPTDQELGNVIITTITRSLKSGARKPWL